MRSISVCRVLVVPRAAYEQVAAAFPIGARTVLTNLLSRAQEVRRTPCPLLLNIYDWPSPPSMTMPLVYTAANSSFLSW